jgi:hypothetical protein
VPTSHGTPPSYTPHALRIGRQATFALADVKWSLRYSPSGIGKTCFRDALPRTSSRPATSPRHVLRATGVRPHSPGSLLRPPRECPKHPPRECPKHPPQERPKHPLQDHPKYAVRGHLKHRPSGRPNLLPRGHPNHTSRGDQKRTHRDGLPKILLLRARLVSNPNDLRTRRTRSLANAATPVCLSKP